MGRPPGRPIRARRSGVDHPGGRTVHGTLGTVPADVWINDDDRVVKMHLVIDGSAFDTSGGTADLTMQITDFGVPVDVQPPPADETSDLSALLGTVQS